MRGRTGTMASSRHCVTIDALKPQVLPSVMHLLDTDTVTLSLTVSVTDSLTTGGSFCRTRKRLWNQVWI